MHYLKNILGCFILLFTSFSAKADWQTNMSVGATPISHDVYNLHMTVFWVCASVAVIVFSVLIYALIMHRKSRGAEPAKFHKHIILEITWIIIPFIILVTMAIPATKILIKMHDNNNAELTIKVTGYQWKWKYEYLEQNINFFSNLSTPPEQLKNQAPKQEWYLREVDHPLVVPVNKKIRFLFTSNDVIHSWWVPTLSIKRDAIPGFINEAWARIEKPGTYRGQCAELCGTNHAFMPIVVEAVSEDEFNKWVNQQTAQRIAATVTTKLPIMSKQELMKLGAVVYNKVCAVCHKPDGTGMPPAIPALKNSKIVKGPVAGHMNISINGKPGTAMQAFGTQLSDTELAAVLTYERNMWGNNMGDLVQPADVEAFKKNK